MRHRQVPAWSSSSGPSRGKSRRRQNRLSRTIATTSDNLEAKKKKESINKSKLKFYLKKINEPSVHKWK